MTTHFSVIRAIETIMGLQPKSGSLNEIGGFYPPHAPSDGAETVFVADYRNFLAASPQLSAFTTLWGVSNDCTPTDTDSLFKQLEGTRCIVLVESPPAQAAEILHHPNKTEYAKHLRAADWALAYCARLTKAGATAKTVTAPMVIVLDLYSTGDSDAAESFNTAGLSCLKVFSARSGVHHIDAFITALQSASGPQKAKVETKDIKRLTRQWLSSLADASGDDDEIGRSHYLNNLLGPLALAVGLEPVGQSNGLRQWVAASLPGENDCHVPGRRALMNALEWSGRGNQKEVKKPELASLPILNRELRVLVLDDQIEDGWVPILAEALGISEIDKEGIDTTGDAFAKIATNASTGISLWVNKDPDNMLSILEQKEHFKAGWPNPLRFTGTPGDKSEPEFDEILLLDLRLFANQGGPTSLSPVQLAFESRLRNALSLAESWGDDPHDPKRLTGLARLIIQRDYTYPVVIWSSTGQRHIIDSLREYENIETGLRKPKFDTYGHGAEEFLQSFADTLSTAQQMNKARHWMHTSIIHPFCVQAENPLFRRVQEQVGKFELSTVFIYLDESNGHEDKNFKQGGVAVIVSCNHGTWTDRSHLIVNTFVDKEISLRNRNGEACSVAISSNLKEDYFKWQDANNLGDKRNAVVYYDYISSILDRNDTHCGITCVPVAVLDMVQQGNMKIDARNIGGIQRMLAGIVASISNVKKKIDIKLDVDGRRIPLVFGADGQFDHEWWYDIEELETIKTINKTQKFQGTAIAYNANGDWFPPFATAFSLQKKRRGASKVMSSSVQPVVVHGVVATVLQRLQKKYSLTFVGAKSTHYGEGTYTKVLRNIADFMPRFAYKMQVPTTLDCEFLSPQLLLSHKQDNFPSIADRLLDVLFSTAADQATERTLIQIAEILGPSNPPPQINSFESIAITRLYSEIEPRLSNTAFWNLARLLP